MTQLTTPGQFFRLRETSVIHLGGDTVGSTSRLFSAGSKAMLLKMLRDTAVLIHANGEWSWWGGWSGRELEWEPCDPPRNAAKYRLAGVRFLVREIGGTP